MPAIVDCQSRCRGAVSPKHEAMMRGQVILQLLAFGYSAPTYSWTIWSRTTTHLLPLTSCELLQERLSQIAAVSESVLATWAILASQIGQRLIFGVLECSKKLEFTTSTMNLLTCSLAYRASLVDVDAELISCSDKTQLATTQDRLGQQPRRSERSAFSER
jgi:hypothetical protein